MPTARRWLLAALSAACLAAPLSAAPAPSDKERIARWVQELGDDDFQRREAASRRLWEAGQAAEPALQAATDSRDAEVSRRAREILERFKWGIYPDTPKQIVELVQRYQSSDRGASGAVIKELFENGTAGCKAVLKIARAEDDPGIRRRVLAQISNEMARAVPMLLAEDNYDTLALLLDHALDQALHAENPLDHEANKKGIRDYAAFWLLRGKLGDRIAHFRDRTAKSPGDRKAREVLAYLHRANGDLASARAAADEAGRPELLDALLQESGAWKELAARPVGTETTPDAERLGLRAAYLRLAGDAKGFEGAASDLRKLSDDAKDDEATAFLVAKALFLNDRPADAVAVLNRAGNRAMSFEILASRMQFREALKQADAEREAKGGRLPELEILEARTWYSLGEKEKALPVFARYAQRLRDDAESAWYETLVESEYRVGLREQARAHAAKVMSLSKDQGWQRRLLPKVFPNREEQAEVWWDYLRQHQPSRDPAEMIKEVADLLAGRLPRERVRALVEGAREALKAPKARPEVAEQWSLALAEAALAAGEEALGRDLLEKSASGGALVKLGDLDADKKRWEAAAAHYRRARDASPRDPLPLFLWGRALVLAGQKDEGGRRMEQAHWLPLGNEEARLDFSKALARRGLAEACRRENDLLLRLSQPASYYSGEAQRQVALDAQAKQDFLRSADGQERAMLRCLRTNVNFVQSAAYVGVPALVHRQRARGFLAAGKAEEALREAAKCLEELPGDVDVATLLVPELDKAGRQREADKLFNQVLAVYDGVCKDHPDCAWAHNSAAWLAACCRRDLDAGLARARKATELSPDVAGYQDTLAEVWFQRGEKDKAVAAQKKAVELDPKKAYYRKQLKRYEAGDLSAPRPSEDEDDEED